MRMISWNDIHPNNVSLLDFVPFAITIDPNHVLYIQLENYTYIHSYTYVLIHTYTYRHTDRQTDIHTSIPTYIRTNIYIIMHVLCILGIFHGRDLNSLYRGNRVSWSFAHNVSCFFFCAWLFQETKEWQAAISELQDLFVPFWAK